MLTGRITRIGEAGAGSAPRRRSFDLASGGEAAGRTSFRAASGGEDAADDYQAASRRTSNIEGS